LSSGSTKRNFLFEIFLGQGDRKIWRFHQSMEIGIN
jgi:hypothetical protein